MKPFRILIRSFRDSLKSVFRNFSLSIASITCITITLILVSISIILTTNVNNFTKDLESDLTIVIFMNRNSTEDDINALRNLIEENDNVDEDQIDFMSKEQVRKQMQDESETFNSIMSTWTEETNPLQDQFMVKVKEINDISKTAKELRNLKYVDSVKYGEGMVDQLVAIFDIVEKVSIVTVVALVIVTAFLISNTIKLSIFSRKTEIDIMRLVGTSNIAIKLPFIFEGFILGIIGSLIPIIVTIYGYIVLYERMGGYLFSRIIVLISPTNLILKLSLILLLIGSLVGMLGSYKAVRKYLKI